MCNDLDICYTLAEDFLGKYTSSECMQAHEAFGFFRSQVSQCCFVRVPRTLCLCWLLLGVLHRRSSAILGDCFGLCAGIK
jgi:hypothetical protein